MVFCKSPKRISVSESIGAAIGTRLISVVVILGLAIFCMKYKAAFLNERADLIFS